MESGRGPGWGRGPGLGCGPILGGRKVSAIENVQKDYLVRNACINICKHTLKFSYYILVRVIINNYNYEQPIAPFLILRQKKHLRQGVIQCNRCFANYFYSTRINALMLYQQPNRWAWEKPFNLQLPIAY